jgi:LPXTG-motif cell wall-anchored protein
MATLHDHHDTEDWSREPWSTEGWTGEQDSAAAIALGACLALAALLFLFFAAGLLHA